MTSEVCREKDEKSLIVHKGSLASESYRKSNCKVTKTISLLQKPEESALLDFSLSFSYDNYYSETSYNLEYNFTLTFENNLHEVSKNYGYEIEFYLCVQENGLSTHKLLFSQKKMRETNKISISRQSKYHSNYSCPDILDRFRENSDKQHLCCSIRRYNVKIAEDIDKQPIQNIHIGAMLYETGLYSDVSLVVGEKLFSVHKHVLSAASSIFKAMFSHDMVENQNGKVIIEDFNPEVVEGLLSFIYTGKTSSLSKMPIELFQVSHKYEIEILKTQCMEQFLFMLNSENVVDILYTASMYELENLRADLLKFIQVHEEEMVKEESFQIFLCRDLKVDTVTYTLKLCDKYRQFLEKVETEAFEFIEKHNKNLVKNMEFMKLFETHSLLMKRLYAFIHKNG